MKINIISKETITDSYSGRKELKYVDSEGNRYYKNLEAGSNNIWTAMPSLDQEYFEGYGKTIEKAYKSLKKHIKKGGC